MKFLTMIYQHGPSRGRRILSARAVAAMLSDQTGGAPMAESPFPGALYGIGNWLDNPDGTGGASQHGCMGVAGWTPLIDAATGFLAVVGMQDMLLLVSNIRLAHL